MRTAVITLAHGRHGHLRRQLQGLARSATQPSDYVVVALGDPELAGVLASSGYSHRLVELPADAELPLAQARNFGAATALAAGAELLVFLDVDCIPDGSLLARYQAAAGQPEHADALLCGPVSYLPPAPPAGYPSDGLAELAEPHPARPAPPDGTVLIAHDRRLFWSLSFAVTARTWQRVGGFHEGYRGYGGEDTDFVESAHAAGVGMRWVGGALAFHQHHAVSSPPVEHLDAILRNARLFHERWGWWPMSGWLDQFAARGLAEHDADRGWVATARTLP